jgi:phage RecT family recombinase
MSNPENALVKIDKGMIPFRQVVEQRRDDLVKLLPKSMDPERFLMVAFQQFYDNPALLNCDPVSFYLAIQEAAQVGLYPSRVSKEAFLIPYGNKCQLQPGYIGLAKLAKKVPGVQDVWAEIVYKEDVFEVELLPMRRYIHRQDLDSLKENKNIRGAYGVILFDDGYQKFKWLNIHQILRLRDAYSKGYKIRKAKGEEKQHPWHEENPGFPAMCLKTLIIHVLKDQEKTPELESMLSKAYDPEDQQPIIDLPVQVNVLTGSQPADPFSAPPPAGPTPAVDTTRTERIKEAVAQGDANARKSASAPAAPGRRGRKPAASPASPAANPVPEPVIDVRPEPHQPQVNQAVTPPYEASPDDVDF